MVKCEFTGVLNSKVHSDTHFFCPLCRFWNTWSSEPRDNNPFRGVDLEAYVLVESFRVGTVFLYVSLNLSDWLHPAPLKSHPLEDYHSLTKDTNAVFTHRCLETFKTLGNVQLSSQKHFGIFQDIIFVLLPTTLLFWLTLTYGCDNNRMTKVLRWCLPRGLRSLPSSQQILEGHFQHIGLQCVWRPLLLCLW